MPLPGDSAPGSVWRGQLCSILCCFPASSSFYSLSFLGVLGHKNDARGYHLTGLCPQRGCLSQSSLLFLSSSPGLLLAPPSPRAPGLDGKALVQYRTSTCWAVGRCQPSRRCAQVSSSHVHVILPRNRALVTWGRSLHKIPCFYCQVACSSFP